MRPQRPYQFNCTFTAWHPDTGERMGANRSGKRLGGFTLVRKDARLRAGQDHRRLRLAVYVSCTARADASSPAARDTSYPSLEASHDAYAQLPLEFAP